MSGSDSLSLSRMVRDLLFSARPALADDRRFVDTVQAQLRSGAALSLVTKNRLKRLHRWTFRALAQNEGTKHVMTTYASLTGWVE